MILILFLLFDYIYLNKYEKGNEKNHILFIIFLLFIIYEMPLIEIYTKPIRLIIEITLPPYIFFQFYNLNSNINNKYIVILGCGLLDNNRLSNLLIQRCNIAINIYHQNENKIIVSGGQGKDESISEAKAMKDYLISQHILEEDIICEDKSTNTKENLLYSSYIIKDSFTVISSDFHRPRVYLLSYINKLNIHVKTSKTIFYYRIYASTREYFAILSLFSFSIIISYFLLFFLL